MSPRARHAAAFGAAATAAALVLAPDWAPAQERRAPDAPQRPRELVSFLTGDPDDLEVAPGGPALLLMGGGRDVDHAFAWFCDLVRGGDVVVLRTSGADGYNAYLYQQIGGIDSVETLLVTTRELAESPWVARRIEEAEGVFIAGGDQSTYVRAWKGTALERALHAAWRRGAALGGTSAGAAILGQFSYAALHGGLTSDGALRDPFTRDLTLERDFLRLSFLEGAVIDTHFGRRDREGRMLAFLARLMADGWHERPLGIGLDEETALAIGRGGKARVFGKGAVTIYRPGEPPSRCEPGRALRLEGVGAWTLRRNDTVDLPAGPGGAPARRVAAIDGAVR